MAKKTPEEIASSMAAAKLSLLESAIDKNRADAEASRAKASLKMAEISRHAAEVELVNIQRGVSEISLAKTQRQEEEVLASNAYHCLYPFTEEVAGHSVGACIAQLTLWMRTRPGSPIEIVFNSPGGDVVEGMALFDFIQQVRRAGHHVTTMTIGVAASMAGILLQAGDTRVMGKEAWVLIHEASFGARGKIGEVEDTVKWVKMVQGRILKIFASRSKLSERAIAARWKRTDWWLSSDECLKYGLVDEVR